MTTKTEICNLALTFLGQKTITSITEATTSAQKCNLLFDVARDTTLRAHPWNFATRIVELTELADDAVEDDELVTGWNYIYQYPTTALYIRKVFSSESTGFVEPDKFKEVLSSATQTKAIATDVNPAYCEYIEKELDISLYDSSFTIALAYFLASQLAQSLTGDTNLSNRMFNLYQQSIDQAKYHNATEANENERQTSTYLDAR